MCSTQTQRVFKYGRRTNFHIFTNTQTALPTQTEVIWGVPTVGRQLKPTAGSDSNSSVVPQMSLLLLFPKAGVQLDFLFFAVDDLETPRGWDSEKRQRLDPPSPPRLNPGVRPAVWFASTARVLEMVHAARHHGNRVVPLLTLATLPLIGAWKDAAGGPRALLCLPIESPWPRRGPVFFPCPRKGGMGVYFYKASQP